LYVLSKNVTAHACSRILAVFAMKWPTRDGALDGREVFHPCCPMAKKFANLRLAYWNTKAIRGFAD
jgi:hypothetical protein